MRGLPHALIEVRQDLIATRQGAQAWADRIAEGLAPVVADPAVRHVKLFGSRAYR